MKSIEIEIQRLDLCLKKFCKPMHDRLLEPMKKEVIESILAPWGYDDNHIVDIFQWKNGIPYDESLPTYCFDYTEFGVIPPLEYIVDILNIEKRNKSWNDSLFPLVVSYGGDFLLYETNKKSRNYGAIYLYSPNLGYVDHLPRYFDSIFSLIDTIIENFESGAFKYLDMSLEIDYDLTSKISKRLNPASEYWNS